ncbi:MAG: hypothetical protein HUJ60_00245 [Bacilli bacterium]|nr:hypothetical protein [Bacilli bacterium]
MSNSLKPGGGNKPQPYIPAGNGESSGEYTNKEPNKSLKREKRIVNCCIRNIRCRYNFYNSKFVGRVVSTYKTTQGTSIPKTGKPNSVYKKLVNGFVVTERYYNNQGEAYLDIDYTCHGNSKKHPCVPHIHRWKKDENGELKRGEWEVFQ